MICSQCGTENQSKFKFCVKCGSNLENPKEINIEQIALGGYHSEDDPNSGGFKIGSGTFTVRANLPADTSNALFTADELNDTDEEFDFSSFDDPSVPDMGSGRAAAHEPPKPLQPVKQPNMYGYTQAAPNNMYGAPIQPQQRSAMSQPNMTGMPVYGQPQPNMTGMPVYGQPQPMMYAQPQVIGYDPNGMPIYSQPQIIGYDPNGMPIYGQPMMYTQPQIIGYDPNGMPIYGQPMMYVQPQIMGYDPNGIPIYGQPAMIPPQPAVNDMGEAVKNPYQQAMPYQPPPMQGFPQPQPADEPDVPEPQTEEDKELADALDKFWEFFNGGKSSPPEENDSSDDFFGKHEDSSSEADGSRLKRFEHDKDSSMDDTPVVDADKLVPNTADKFNKMYMKKTEAVNADDLEANKTERKQDIMGVTENVDAADLDANTVKKGSVTMVSAGEADSGQLEEYVPEHKEALMSHEVHAVEALPKKKKTYNDIIDEIELPEQMKSKKTLKNDAPEIPELPEKS